MYITFREFLKENFENNDYKNYEKIIDKLNVDEIVKSCINKVNKIADDLLGVGALLFTGGNGRNVAKNNPYNVFFIGKYKIPVKLEVCNVKDAPSKYTINGGRLIFPVDSINTSKDISDISFDDLDKEFPSIEFKEHEKNKKLAVVEKCGFPLFKLKNDLKPVDFIYNSLNNLVPLMHMGSSDPIEVLVKASHGDEKLLTELNKKIENPDSATNEMSAILKRILSLSDNIFAVIVSDSIDLIPDVGDKFSKMLKPLKK